MKPLRPYQLAAYKAACAHILAGRRRVCICGPCGMGKTRLGAEFCLGGQAKGSRALWLTHRETLIKQSHAALLAEGVDADIIAPWATRQYKRISVASVPTLLARDMRPEVDFIIADEVHHFVSKEYLALLRDYPNAIIIGLTATPARPDGIGLNNAFQALVPVCQPRDLIASGHLVPARVIGPSSNVRNLADYPVDFYRANCPGEFCVVLCSTIQQARDLASAFTIAGIPAGYVDSEMDDGLRDATLEKYESGKIRVLTSVNIFLEGWDSPQTSAVILARKMGSSIAYIQATGRAMRPFPGKTRALIGDLYGSSHALRMVPDGDRDYSLEGRGVAGTRAIDGEPIDMPQCPQCGNFFQCAMWRGGPCPSCGWQRPPKPNPAVVKRELVEIKLDRQATRVAGSPMLQARVQWLQERLAKSRGRTGGILVAYSKAFPYPPQMRFPNTAIREASGFNECLRREKEERERAEAQRVQAPLFTRRSA